MQTFMQTTCTCKRNQYNWMENYQKLTFLSSVESNINTGTIVFVTNTNIATTLVCNFQFDHFLWFKSSFLALTTMWFITTPLYIASVTMQPEIKQQHTILSSEWWQERISLHVPHKEVAFLDQEVNNTPMPTKKSIFTLILAWYKNCRMYDAINYYTVIPMTRPWSY